MQAFKKMNLVLMIMAFSVSNLAVFPTRAGTALSSGKLYRMVGATNKYTATGQNCSVSFGSVSSVPRKWLEPSGLEKSGYVHSFDYQLIGFPAVMNNYDTGKASQRTSNLEKINNAEVSFAPDSLGVFAGNRVTVSFQIPEMTVQEFSNQPKVKAIRAIYDNPDFRLLGGYDVVWAYECRWD